VDCHSADQFSVPPLAAQACSLVLEPEWRVARQNVLVREPHAMVPQNAPVVLRGAQDDSPVPVVLEVSYRG
jgi:hypothetical protein